MADSTYKGRPILYLPAVLARQIAAEEPMPSGVSAMFEFAQDTTRVMPLSMPVRVADREKEPKIHENWMKFAAIMRSKLSCFDS